jgi:nitrite reductase/ring-hydroxylating ferredoxin subunit
MGTFRKAAEVQDVAPGTARLVNVAGLEIALSNVDGELHALDNACTHQWGPLAEGQLEGHVVTCPWHGSPFDVRTGEALGPPADSDVARYAVRIRGSDIEIEVPD